MYVAFGKYVTTFATAKYVGRVYGQALMGV